VGYKVLMPSCGLSVAVVDNRHWCYVNLARIYMSCIQSFR
jgi:hypothetical protein